MRGGGAGSHHRACRARIRHFRAAVYGRRRASQHRNHPSGDDGMEFQVLHRPEKVRHPDGAGRSFFPALEKGKIKEMR